MTDKTKGVKGISMFLVDAGTPGLSTGNEENKMGIRTSNTCDVVLEDCRIPAANLVGEEGRGFSIAMKTLDQARAWMGCVATGIAQRGINEGIAYAKERVQFGNSALEFTMQAQRSNQALSLMFNLLVCRWKFLISNVDGIKVVS